MKDGLLDFAKLKCK